MKSLFDEISKSPVEFPMFSGLQAELNKNPSSIREVFAKRLDMFETNDLAFFVNRYEGQVNIDEAIILVDMAKRLYRQRLSGG